MGATAAAAHRHEAVVGAAGLATAAAALPHRPGVGSTAEGTAMAPPLVLVIIVAGDSVGVRQQSTAVVGPEVLVTVTAVEAQGHSGEETVSTIGTPMRKSWWEDGVALVHGIVGRMIGRLRAQRPLAMALRMTSNQPRHRR